MNALFAMSEVDADAIFLVQMLGEVLGTIDRTVLAACATEGEHQVGKAALDVAFHVGIGQTIDAVQEGQNLAIVLQKLDDRSVQTRDLLVGLIAAWIVRRTAVEDIASTVAARVFWDAAFVGERENTDG